VLITPSVGVPNWSVIYIINTAPPMELAQVLLSGGALPTCRGEYSEMRRRDWVGVGRARWRASASAAGLGSRTRILPASPLDLGGASGWGKRSSRYAQYPTMSRPEAGHSGGVLRSVNWPGQY
jgi:hypothetical protein